MMRSRIIIALALFMLFVAGMSVWWYFSTTRTVEVTFQDVSSLTLTNGDESREISDISNGDSVRIAADTEYQLEYTGEDTFADGSVAIGVDQENVSIRPDYSDDYYRELEAAFYDDVQDGLNDEYPGIDSYSPRAFRMFNRAEWSLIVFRFDGDYGFNSDDLRILYRKDSNGSWSRVTEPEIIFDIYDYPEIDRDILSEANRV